MTGTLAMPSMEVFSLSHELVLVGAGVLILLLDAFIPPARRLAVPLASLAVVAALLLPWAANPTSSSFGGLIEQSGMTAAMNGSINFSTYDGWICEFARDGENSFIIPPAAEGLSPEARAQHDMDGFYHILENKVLPLYYDEPKKWWPLVEQSMNDVVPFFDSDRMAAEYYEKLYDAM